MIWHYIVLKVHSKSNSTGHLCCDGQDSLPYQFISCLLCNYTYPHIVGYLIANVKSQCQVNIGPSWQCTQETKLCWTSFTELNWTYSQNLMSWTTLDPQLLQNIYRSVPPAKCCWKDIGKKGKSGLKVKRYLFQV